jgi:hypothetical protein
VGYTASYFYHDKVLKTIGYVNEHTFLIGSSFLLTVMVSQGTLASALLLVMRLIRERLCFGVLVEAKLLLSTPVLTQKVSLRRFSALPCRYSFSSLAAVLRVLHGGKPTIASEGFDKVSARSYTTPIMISLTFHEYKTLSYFAVQCMVNDNIACN